MHHGLSLHHDRCSVGMQLCVDGEPCERPFTSLSVILGDFLGLCGCIVGAQDFNIFDMVC